MRQLHIPLRAMTLLAIAFGFSGEPLQCQQVHTTFGPVTSGKTGGLQAEVRTSESRLLPPLTVVGDTKPSDWHLTFADDFDSSHLQDCWKGSYFGGVHTLKANGELEYYTLPGEIPGFTPAYIDSGVLYLNAKPTPSEQLDKADRQPYLSGMIMSDGCFAQKFGYFEIRTKIPQGRGLWPAFWLLPAKHIWPPEIDVFEMFGAANSRGEGGIGQVHTGIVTGMKTDGNRWHTVQIDQYAGFHSYGLLWSPELLKFYVDGQLIGIQLAPENLREEMYLIANLAVGGKWVETPDTSTRFPAAMAIDYIRVWQFKPWDASPPATRRTSGNP